MRNGTVTFLGAGASSEAGYPLSAELYEIYYNKVEEYSKKELVRRKQHEESWKRIKLLQESFPDGLPEQGFTTEKWFSDKWRMFEQAYQNIKPLIPPVFDSDGNPVSPSDTWRDPIGGYYTWTFTPKIWVDESHNRKPYLETFFAYYDTILHPLYYPLFTNIERNSVIHWFKILKDLAVDSIYHCLNSYGKETPTYLLDLFSLEGPKGRPSMTITLNQDTSIEHMLYLNGITFYDGFKLNNPLTVFSQNNGEIKRSELICLLDKINENYLLYKGFNQTSGNVHIYVKLHGSLGWFALEEGGGEIGLQEDLRNNVTHQHFRLPYNVFWSSDWKEKMNEIKSLKYQWVRAKPYLIFARANKFHQNPLLHDQINFVYNQLKNTKNILVVGYGWQDTHVNDTILHAVAQGANIINVSKNAVPKHVLGLWAQKFPTTFKTLRKKMYMFGGGAKNVLQEKKVILPKGDHLNIDIINLLNNELPEELSIQYTLGDENQSRARRKKYI